MKKLRYILSLLCVILCSQNMMAQSDRQFIRSGNRLYRQENYAKAEVEYRKALGRNSHNPQALYNLGCALMSQQKDSVAITQFQEAGRIETARIRKAAAYHNIGVICQKHQLYGEAVEAYKESLRNNPSDNETRYNLVLCMRQQKKQKQNNKKQDNKKKNNQNDSKKNQDKQQDSQDKQQKNKNDKMSKDNAEQLLNYAVQEEKATQQRLNRSKQKPQTRHLQKNW